MNRGAAPWNQSRRMVLLCAVAATIAAAAVAMAAGASRRAPPPPASLSPGTGGTGAPAALGAQAGPETPLPALDRPPFQAYFEPMAFYGGLRRALAERAARQGATAAMGAAPATGAAAAPLLGGVVPHHLLPGHLISDFFLDLAAAPPRTVVVIGPNHENRGPRVATSRRGWSTPFGVVAADPAWVDWLAAEGLAAEDDAALAPEHSVGGLMPYIAYHLPGARVVPIILHRGVTAAEARRLAGALATRIGPEAVLVGSVDFSHYLPRNEAEARDRETLAVIGRRDWETLLAMGNEHLDSPATVAVVFMAMAAAGAGEPELVAHTNSGALVGSDGVETTSYLVFQFRRGPR